MHECVHACDYVHYIRFITLHYTTLLYSMLHCIPLHAFHCIAVHCMHTCKHTCTHTHILTSIHPCKQTYIQTIITSHTYMFIHVCTFIIYRDVGLSESVAYRKICKKCLAYHDAGPKARTFVEHLWGHGHIPAPHMGNDQPNHGHDLAMILTRSSLHPPNWRGRLSASSGVGQLDLTMRLSIKFSGITMG